MGAGEAEQVTKVPLDVSGFTLFPNDARMVLAMEDVGIEEDIRKVLLSNFFNTADFMRNKEG